MKELTRGWLYGLCDYMQGYDAEPCGECCPQCKKAKEELKKVVK